jgi:hypothetical protein
MSSTIHFAAASISVHVKGAAWVNPEAVVKTGCSGLHLELPARLDGQYAYSLKIVSSH